MLLGDFIDRGPMSAQIINHLMTRASINLNACRLLAITKMSFSDISKILKSTRNGWNSAANRRSPPTGLMCTARPFGKHVLRGG